MQVDVTTWIVTADDRRVAVHEERVRGGRLHPVPAEALEADHGLSDHAHRATVHVRHGDMRHGAGERDVSHLEAQRFLGQVAQMIQAAAEAKRFQRLVLMAPPRALGILRGALGKDVTDRLELTEPHERLHLAAPALRQALRAARTRA